MKALFNNIAQTSPIKKSDELRKKLQYLLTDIGGNGMSIRSMKNPVHRNILI